MNIRSQPTDPSRSGPLRSESAGNAEDLAQAESAGEASSAATGDAGSDRVEISDAARSAQTGQPGDAHLVERGRQALGEASSLSPDRLAGLKQRVAEGHYTDPDTTRQVAERLAGDLARSREG